MSDERGRQIEAAGRAGKGRRGRRPSWFLGIRLYQGFPQYSSISSIFTHVELLICKISQHKTPTYTYQPQVILKMITVDICSTAISMNIIIKPRTGTQENYCEINCLDSVTVYVFRNILLQGAFYKPQLHDIFRLANATIT